MIELLSGNIGCHDAASAGNSGLNSGYSNRGRNDEDSCCHEDEEVGDVVNVNAA